MARRAQRKWCGSPPFDRLRAGSFDRLRAGSEVGERLGEHPAGRIIGEADGGLVGISARPRTAQAVAQAGRHRQRQVNEPRARQQGE